MQQSSAEVELDQLADLCGSLRLHHKGNLVAGCLLDPIASILGAESAAYRHVDLRQHRPRILHLDSIGVAGTVADDYLTHFHRFDPFLDRLPPHQADTDSVSDSPVGGNSFQSYYHDFLQPNDLVHHVGFILRDSPGHQAWVFNFHRRAASADFAALELARARLIEACLQGQASGTTQPENTGPRAGNLAALTSREHEIVMAVAAGYSNKAIADRLQISPRTVENHLRSIYDKLRINTRTRLLSLVYQQDYTAAEGQGE